jgi:hypothetical protein
VGDPLGPVAERLLDASLVIGKSRPLPGVVRDQNDWSSFVAADHFHFAGHRLMIAVLAAQQARGGRTGILCRAGRCTTT